VILNGEVLEVRNVDGSIQIARKTKKQDDWNPAIPDYDPCARHRRNRQSNRGVTSFALKYFS
jgi:hypothetical protein